MVDLRDFTDTKTGRGGAREMMGETKINASALLFPLLPASYREGLEAEGRRSIT
jgi:hypothetical protein